MFYFGSLPRVIMLQQRLINYARFTLCMLTKDNDDFSTLRTETNQDQYVAHVETE